ncbi:type I polyketide synthase [Teredinibacter turnerae]|uniref:type I polyketide synthase n=1 Tax=Teredinibacter turnerae TaxID=2426 RepID=UPI000373B9C4|nr:type I polyketide synthase [Teredinibacter turnerae]
MTTDELQSVAVVGMACRFPGANDVDTFWQNLAQGEESITSLSDEQLRSVGVSEQEITNGKYVKKASLVDAVDLFDADFFQFTPREAEITDPQHRVLIETLYEALEHAGYAPGRIDGKIGLYAGVGMNGYLINNILKQPDLLESIGMYPLLIGNDKCYAASQIAYKLNFTGPVMAVDTACSTGLVATHQAYRSLLAYDCDLALAGAVKLNVPQTGYLYEQGGINSPDGCCRPFDDKAGGTIFGSGSGVVALKRLEDARRDGDTIHAVIRGSSINNDGTAKVGFTAPSVEGQQDVISDAIMFSDVDAETITYVETHGTGTRLGDPIEFQALQNAFSTFTNKKQYCAIGSVKSNIGHLETAAGMAGLIKVILALKNKKIPPSLNYSDSNAEIDFDNSCFYVNKHLRDWDDTTLLRAGVSSFGIGGTNAHIVIEQAPPQEVTISNVGIHLLPISAKSPIALQQKVVMLEEFLRKNKHVNIADVAYTLQCGRGHFEFRTAVYGSDAEELVNRLGSLQLGNLNPVEIEALDRNLQDEDLADCSQEQLRSVYEKIVERWLSGQAVNWNSLYAHESRRRVPLPLYPFQKKRYWVDPPGYQSLISVPKDREQARTTSPSKENELKSQDEFTLDFREVQCAVISIWQDLLGVPNIQPDDNYFDLGGQSLTASRIITRVEEVTGIEMQVKDLFDAGTAELFAEAIYEQQLLLLEGEDIDALLVETS